MSESQVQPNIIVIMLDDMGFSDIGCFGAEIETPHLDRLGRGGLRFSQFYNAARCCPTRASILTGLYPHQAGIGGMVGRGKTPAYQGFLSEQSQTIAEALRPAGYATCMVGKWHVGGAYAVNKPETWTVAGDAEHPLPTQRGFDRFYGTLTGAGSYWRPPTLMRQETFIDADSTEYFYTDALGDEAATMIRETPAGQPLFMYMTPTAPHWPLHARPADIEKYRGRYTAGWDVLRRERHERLLAEGLVKPEWGLSPRDEAAGSWVDTEHAAWEDLRMATYAAQVDNLDQNVGKLITALEETGRFADTLIVFLSDNGGCAEYLREDGDADSWPGHYAVPTVDGRPTHVGNDPGREPGPADTFMSYDLPWANASNTPFRKFKSFVHEGGISTPFFMHWPARIQPGISHEVAHIIDLQPTFCELAGATYTGATPLPGESLAALLAGEPWSRREPLYWEHFGCKGMRDGDWKLVAERSGGSWELYHIASDRTELHDRLAEEPARAERMTAAWQAWADGVGVEAR